jgi:type I restriction enzyme, S subunit
MRQMPATWQIKQLKEVAIHRMGGTPSTDCEEYWNNGDVLWATPSDLGRSEVMRVRDTARKITSAGLTAKHAETYPPGTVLLSTTATIGNLGIADSPTYCNQQITAIIPDETVLSEYLAYYLLRSKADLIRLGGTSTATHINQKNLGTLCIPIPSLDEQRHIIDILSRAEGIIRLRREAQKKSEEMIPALFLDMFGDPTTNPKGWNEVLLGSVIKEFRYGTSRKSGPTGYPTLRISNVIGNHLDPSEIKLVDVPDGEAQRLRLHNGDLLFVRTNGNPDYVGRSAVFNTETIRVAGFAPENCLYASYLIRGRIMREIISPHYLQVFLSSVEGRHRLKERCRTSAGQYNINIDGLSNISLPLPPLDEQLRLERCCSDIFSIQSQQTSALQKAEATFDALLAHTFKEEKH